MEGSREQAARRKCCRDIFVCLFSKKPNVFFSKRQSVSGKIFNHGALNADIAWFQV
jgi:hypothetical protein